MKKILAIDGGGIRGIIPATILSQIEEQTNQPVADLFDLVAGTSTGGLITLMLTKDNGNGTPQYTAAEVANMYHEHGPDIFKRSLWKTIVSGGGYTDEKYSHEALFGVLEKYLRNDPLSMALKPVLITTYDLEKRRPFFLTNWNDDTRRVLMRDAAYATSAAPTYFEPAHIAMGDEIRALVDGGVFVQNPAMSAYAEARRLFPDEASFLVVSLGTGKMTRPIWYEEAKNWGRLEWFIPILSVIFDGVSEAVDHQLIQIPSVDYYRFQTELIIASDDMDDASNRNLRALKQEAERLIRDQKAELEQLCQRLLTGSGAVASS